MYNLIANTSMKNWLNVNLKKYASYNANKYVKDYYYGKVKSKEFEISVYTTNLVTIKGNPEFQNRIFKALVINSKELDTQGMDEVGVGDFFGPVVYVSVFLDEKSLDFLANNPVTINDSKKLTDFEIIKTYELLKDDISYNKQIIYDHMFNDHNSIEQKIIFHNENLFECSTTVLDLFTTINSFEKYTSKLHLKWPKNLVLETKADSKYLSVALASIFARAIFLKQMDALEKKYDFSFPLGANNVIDSGVEFIAMYSAKELATFCKTSFKTYNQVLELAKKQTH